MQQFLIMIAPPLLVFASVAVMFVWAAKGWEPAEDDKR